MNYMKHIAEAISAQHKMPMTLSLKGFEVVPKGIDRMYVRALGQTPKLTW